MSLAEYYDIEHTNHTNHMSLAEYCEVGVIGVQHDYEHTN